MMKNKIKEFSIQNLQGKILISTMDESYGYLAKSVVLIVQHTSKQSFGIIINKPLPFNLKKNIEQKHKENEYKKYLIKQTNGMNIDMLLGGLSNTDIYYLIHNSNIFYSNTIAINTISVTPTSDFGNILYAIENNPHSKFLCSLGCLIWNNFDLEEEILNNQWICCDTTSDFILNMHFNNKWEHGYKRFCSNQSIFINTSGNA